MIPVQEHQNLILAVGVQTQDRNLWNIQTTQVQCQHVSLSWRGEDKFLRDCEISQRGRGPFCIPSEWCKNVNPNFWCRFSPHTGCVKFLHTFFSQWRLPSALFYFLELHLNLILFQTGWNADLMIHCSAMSKFLHQLTIILIMMMMISGTMGWTSLLWF